MLSFLGHLMFDWGPKIVDRKKFIYSPLNKCRKHYLPLSCDSWILLLHVFQEMGFFASMGLTSVKAGNTFVGESESPRSIEHGFVTASLIIFNPAIWGELIGQTQVEQYFLHFTFL